MKMPNFKKDNSISETVYQVIYKQILSGKLKPSDRITEQGLSESMGISRAPIREAFKRLAEDKLVILKPRSGCYIANLTSAEVEEIYEIRKRLESMALEYAFNKIDRDELKKIKQGFKDCKKLETLNLITKEVRLDTKFHKMILDCSGCEILKEMLNKLKSRVEVFRIQEANCLERASQALNEHLKIIDAVISNDLEKSIQVLKEHIENTKKNVLKSFNKHDHIDIGNSVHSDK